MANPLHRWLAGCVLAVATAPLMAQGAGTAAAHFSEGSVIPREVFVTDKQGSQLSLRSLLEAQPGNINVVFIFGGGDLGKNEPGHLWCPDSFEDTHILRTLVGKYTGKPVGFVAIASAPVYHSAALGGKDRVFLDAADDSADFKAARTSFITSTLAAKDAGILPIEPYYDLRLHLMLNTASRTQPGAGYGTMQPWFGAFRAPDDKQFYGVPSFWLVADDGTVLAPPFRGNVYHPHGGELHISYTLGDVDAALGKLLAAQPAAKP